MKWWSMLFPPPPTCWLCESPISSRGWVPVHHRLCRTCWFHWEKIDQPCCKVCGRGNGIIEREYCSDCLRIPEEERIVNRSVLAYSEWSKQWIHLYKYQGKESLALPMGLWMADTVKKQYAEVRFSMITYVPLHPERLKMRGFNQSELLAKVIGKKLKLPVIPLLERRRSTQSQSKRNRRQRLRALENSFHFREESLDSSRNQTVLLVDDVYTTGATVRACAKPLRAKGIPQIYAITFAR